MQYDTVFGSNGKMLINDTPGTVRRWLRKRLSENDVRLIDGQVVQGRTFYVNTIDVYVGQPVTEELIAETDTELRCDFDCGHCNP